MSKFEGALRNSTIAFNGLMVLGFLGLVWLMIFGNLSGNLGFPQVSTSFTNETINLNDTGDIPATADNRVDGSLSSVLVTNASTGEIVHSANYTIVGVTIYTATTTYNTTNVNVSATVSYASESDVSSQTVISNLTAGAKTFFGFSNTLFTIVAIVLLITILLALLYIVMGIVKMTKKGGGGFAE